MTSEKELEKNINKYNKDAIIKKIVAKTGKSITNVREIYYALEDTLVDVLSTADNKNDVTVRLFEGVSINSTFAPAEEKMNNLTGKVVKIADRIKCKANVTKNYCEKLTTHNE